MKRKVVHLSDDQIAAVKRCSAVFSLPLPEAIEEGKLYVEEFQFYIEVEYSEEIVRTLSPETIQHMKTIQEEIDSKSRNKNKHQSRKTKQKKKGLFSYITTQTHEQAKLVKDLITSYGNGEVYGAYVSLLV